MAWGGGQGLLHPHNFPMGSHRPPLFFLTAHPHTGQHHRAVPGSPDLGLVPGLGVGGMIKGKAGHPPLKYAGLLHSPVS